MLALGAGYLINKNLVMQNRLQEKVHESPDLGGSDKILRANCVWDQPRRGQT